MNTHEFEFQTMCMHYLACLLSDGISIEETPARLDEMLLVSPHRNWKNVCEWIGSTCENSEITKILWSNRKRDFLQREADFLWIPPTTTAVHFFDQRARAPLRTRCLPKALRKAGFVMCHLTGTVDLRTLPANLCELDLSDNYLAGGVSLEHLPREIQSIRLHFNKLRAVLVDAPKLPQSLRLVTLWPRSGSVKYIDRYSNRDSRIQTETCTNNKMIEEKKATAKG